METVIESAENREQATTGQANIEIRFACLLAVFAACLALNELGAGKYGDDEIKLSNEKSAAFAWYQSKSIKESLAENQRDLLKTMLKSGSGVTGLEAEIARLDRSIDRYNKEKREILLGSRAVGAANHAQDLDGKLGQIIGAKEYEAQISRLSDAGDRFDLSTLFLQLCLVMGAIGLVIKKERTRVGFFWGMITLGLAGAAFSLAGYVAVLN